MAIKTGKITPCLWFDTEAEDAAKFYVSIFENSRIGRISRYGKEGFGIHGKKEGTVLTVEFDIVIALRTGRKFQWDPAREVFVGDGAKEGNTHLAREMRKPYDYSFAS
jgi:predicted 3-demethylubiquinone-9 3-methyltransferase (glyoxalase superfamily)